MPASVPPPRPSEPRIEGGRDSRGRLSSARLSTGRISVPPPSSHPSLPALPTVQQTPGASFAPPAVALSIPPPAPSVQGFADSSAPHVAFDTARLRAAQAAKPSRLSSALSWAGAAVTVVALLGVLGFALHRRLTPSALALAPAPAPAAPQNDVAEKVIPNILSKTAAAPPPPPLAEPPTPPAGVTPVTPPAAEVASEPAKAARAAPPTKSERLVAAPAQRHVASAPHPAPAARASKPAKSEEAEPAAKAEKPEKTEKRAKPDKGGEKDLAEAARALAREQLDSQL